MKKIIFIATIIISFVTADVSAIDISLYGQLNKGVMVTDDGSDTEFNIVDNDTSSSRFGIKGSQALNNGLTASVVYEVELQSNASDRITQNQVSSTQSTQIGTAIGNGGDTGDLGWQLRHARAGLAGKWGAVFLGHTSSATDTVAEQDLAGTRDVMESDINSFGGGLVFRGGGGTYETETITSATSNMDGNGRTSLVRYDTPIFNGFQLRISHAQGGDIDGAVYYKGNYDALAIKAAIGYVEFNDGATMVSDVISSQLSGSISVKHNSGVGGTVATGRRNLTNKTVGEGEPLFLYGKLGYAWDVYEVALDYSAHSDMVVGVITDEKLTSIGLGGQYNMGYGTSMAVYYRQFDYDDNTTTAFEEISVYGVNLRVKF